MRQEVQQFATDPDVLAAPALLCIGGPADGQRLRVAPGHVLVIASDGPGTARAISLSHAGAQAVAKLTTYRGCYEARYGALYFNPDAAGSDPLARKGEKG